MCTGMEMMAIGQIGQGVSGMFAGDARAAMAEAEGAMQMDAARVQARNILRETERRRGAARAATAASGARIDEFSLGNEQEIVQAGQTDAALEILSGKRAQQAKAIEAMMDRAAGRSKLYGSLFSASPSLGKWRGAKQPNIWEPGYDDTNAQFGGWTGQR